MRTFLLAFGIASVHGCTDTPLWRNKHNCRSEGWQSVHGCEPGGWTCAGYVTQGLCTGSGVAAGKEWTIGATFNYPENNCCACGKQADPVDDDVCTVSSWGAYGTCSAECGGGTQSRTGTGTSDVAGPCVDTPGWRNNNFLCRSEGFQGWEGCEPGGWTCDGYRIQGMCIGNGPGPGMEVTLGWVFNNPELNCCVCGKQAAPSTCQTTETRDCNMHSCDVDCQGHWTMCGTNCEQTYVVDVPARGGGAACEADDGEVRDCAAGEGFCPPACEVTEWNAWGDCSSSCAAGTQARTRTAYRNWPSAVGTCAREGGNTADFANLGQYAALDLFDCLEDCFARAECKGISVDKGFGDGIYCSLTSATPVTVSDNINYTCHVKPPLNLECPLSLEETQACTGNADGCPRECVGGWSSCGADCKQTYDWTVWPAGGAMDCDIADGTSRDCEGDDCPADACMVHNGNKNACRAATDCRWNKMTKLCTYLPPRVNCVGDWSRCNASCDKTFTITTPKQGTGKKCDYADGDSMQCEAGDGDCPQAACSDKNGDKRGCKDMGCKWNKMTKLCTDATAPTGCAANEEAGPCRAVTGCRWKKGKCKGQPREAECKDFKRKEAQCNARPDCVYKSNGGKCKNKRGA